MATHNPYDVQMTRVAWRSWVLVCEFGDRKFIAWGTRRRCFEQFKAWLRPDDKAVV